MKISKIGSIESEEYYLWRIMTYPDFQRYDRVSELMNIRGAYLYPEQLTGEKSFVSLEYSFKSKGDYSITSKTYSNYDPWFSFSKKNFNKVTIKTHKDFIFQEENSGIRGVFDGTYGVEEAWKKYIFFSSAKYSQQHCAKLLKNC